MSTIRKSKRYVELIKLLSSYTSPEVAEKDLNTLREMGFETPAIRNVVKSQASLWNFENAKFCLELSRQKKGPTLAYNVEYISRKFCISIQEAESYIKDYKVNKATSLKSFQKRWGNEIGEDKFKKFQETSKRPLQKMKEDMVSEFGEEVGLEKFSLEMKRRSKSSPEYYIKHEQCGLEEARKRARDYNLKNSGLFISYYKDRGYLEDEIDAVFQKINAQKGNTNRNRKFLKTKFGENWIYHYQEVASSYRKSMENLGQWMPLEELEGFKRYEKLCEFWTSQTIISSEIKNINLRGSDYHLDHEFSIKQGFIDGVEPEIIGSKYNLRIIPAKENCSKNAACSISLETLLNMYYENK